MFINRFMKIEIFKKLRMRDKSRAELLSRQKENREKEKLQGTPFRSGNTAGEVEQPQDYSLLSLSQNKNEEKKKQKQGVFLDGQQGEVSLG